MSAKLPYIYFVSYAHSYQNAAGYGSTEIGTEFPITQYAQVKSIGDVIAHNLRMPSSAIVVLNYQLLRGPEVIGGAS